LRRLSSLDVELIDAFVDSRRVAQLSTAERRIHVDGQPFPIRLTGVEDFGLLRRGLTRPQGDIGSARSVGGGNQRKRATLAFRSPTPTTRSELVRALGATEPSARERRSGIAAGLSVAHLEAAIADWRRLGRDPFLAHYRAPSARKYVVVDGDDEMDAMALILGARVIAGLDLEGPWRGDRENVADPLRRLGFGVEDLGRPTEGPLGPDPENYVGLAERLGGTDVAVRRMGRREQRFLRGRSASPPVIRTPSPRAGCVHGHSPRASWSRRTLSLGTCARTRSAWTCRTWAGPSASLAATHCSSRATWGWTMRAGSSDCVLGQRSPQRYRTSWSHCLGLGRRIGPRIALSTSRPIDFGTTADGRHRHAQPRRPPADVRSQH
jgi:hypothetical protein